jgi:site-specific DNA-cytosine methylase
MLPPRTHALLSPQLPQGDARSLPEYAVLYTRCCTHAPAHTLRSHLRGLNTHTHTHTNTHARTETVGARLDFFSLDTACFFEDNSRRLN